MFATKLLPFSFLSSITITGACVHADLEKCFPNVLRPAAGHNTWLCSEWVFNLADFWTFEPKNYLATFYLYVRMHIIARFDLWQSHIVILDPTSTLKQLLSGTKQGLGPEHTFKISKKENQTQQLKISEQEKATFRFSINIVINLLTYK